MGLRRAVDEERITEAREKFRQERLHRPETPPLIALNQVERDVAREVYKNMEDCMHVAYEKRTGHWIEGGLNSAQVVDALIHAINISRVAQVEDKP